MKKIKCSVCHKEYEPTRMVRLIKQLYGAGIFNQFSQVNRYDFCEDCYNRLLKHILGE